MFSFSFKLYLLLFHISIKDIKRNNIWWHCNQGVASLTTLTQITTWWQYQRYQVVSPRFCGFPRKVYSFRSILFSILNLGFILQLRQVISNSGQSIPYSFGRERKDQNEMLEGIIFLPRVGFDLGPSGTNSLLKFENTGILDHSATMACEQLITL